jgi:hypothetical protein
MANDQLTSLPDIRLPSGTHEQFFFFTDIIFRHSLFFLAWDILSDDSRGL